MLGSCYGKRVVVVAGRGNNGADGRAAAALLARRGVSVKVLEAASVDAGAALPDADLVIDAAYGTGSEPAVPAARSRSGSGARRGHPLRTVRHHRPASR